VDDELHEQATQWMLSLRGDEYDSQYEWYRTDHIRFFEPEEMISRINMLEVG